MTTSMATPEQLSAAFLAEPVVGAGLHKDRHGAATLGSQLDPAGLTLVVFLRHLGCVFCREMVKDIRIAADRADAGKAESRYPRVVFVHTASRERAARFFGRYWPGVTAISDTAGRLDRAAGLARGTLGQLVGPRVAAAALRAIWKGHLVGWPGGDPWMMPGLLLVSPAGRVLYRHAFRHIGDHPRFDRFEAGRCKERVACDGLAATAT